MKKIVFSLILFLCVTTVSARFTLPDFVYRIDDLEKAKIEAKTKKKAITFLYTRTNTKCGLNKSASLEIVKKLKYKTVIVYVNCDSKSERKKRPEIVTKTLRTKNVGKYVPQTVITDAEITNVVAIIPYAKPKKHRSNIRKAITIIGQYLKKQAK